ncbi:MAG: DNA-3-methyladenine glycosylase [Anaerolineae bacterium]|nr:DNA-3-methyladenine glycosylase [Anaerolineae bacterium]
MDHLSHDFFARDTLTVARELLGQRLVRVLDGERLSGHIVEVEAYIGENDRASHARCGITRRNAPMYGPPGHAYVYFIYGMHHCLNAVTEREGYPAAVLIRALEPLEGLEAMRALRSPESAAGRRGGRPDARFTSGPARLCQALGIDRRFDGADLCAPGALLFIEQDAAVPDEAIATGPRIGVRGDEVALTVLWRFYVQDNRHVSR